MTKQWANSLTGRWCFLAFSIFLNSCSNGLTVSTNMGSAIWTASAANLSNWLLWSLGNMLLIEGVIVAITNLLLLRKFDYFRLIRNLLYIIPFSYILQGFADFFNYIGVPDLNIWFRVILDIIGLFGIAAAVSLYQRANLIMHPNDDFPYILRFRFMHGSAVWSQWTSYIPPIILIIISVIETHQLVAVNFGTVYNILTQGYLIGWSDHHFFSKLHHHLNYKY